MPDQFLKDLLSTPGTSGGEQQIQQVVRSFARQFAADVTTDVHGNLYATVNPGGQKTILLDAHCDQIGLIVRHIDSLGFIRVNPAGGWDLQSLPGHRRPVHTSTGPIPGVIARNPIHRPEPDDRNTAPKK